MREFSAEERVTLRDQYRGGASISTLAAGVGISTTSLSVLFDRWGILKRRGRTKALPTRTNNSRTGPVEVDRTLAVKLYRSGQGLARVAGTVGVAPGTLRGLFLEWGVPIRGRAEASKARRAAERREDEGAPEVTEEPQAARDDEMPDAVPCPAPDCGREVMVLPGGALQPHRAPGGVGLCSMTAERA